MAGLFPRSALTQGLKNDAVASGESESENRSVIEKQQITRARTATLVKSGGVVLGGALLAALDGRSVDMLTWVGGWAAYSLLLGAAGVSLGWILRQVAADLTARRAAWTAFLLRLAIGLALVWLLPAFGYADSEVSRGGYVFQDAATRDYQAQVLAGSGQPLFSAFSGDIPGDQYGGLLALSAAVYRYLSPSAHRPLLIVLLAGWMVGLGTALLWGGARRWFGEQGGAGELIPAAAAWVMAVYPEGVLLGASQMREPFAMAAISACFYGLIEVSQKQAGQKQRGLGLVGRRAVRIVPAAAACGAGDDPGVERCMDCRGAVPAAFFLASAAAAGSHAGAGAGADNPAGSEFTLAQGDGRCGIGFYLAGE